MAVRESPSWTQAGSHSAEDDRLLLASLLGGSPNQAVVQGILSPLDLAVTQNGTPNMSVNIAAGAAFIAGTETTTQGVYHLENDASVNVAIATADATNPRIDLIVAQVLDAQYSGASSLGQIVAVTGTPAASPSVPATPKNSIVLARIAVAHSVTTIVTANITDERPIACEATGNPSGTLVATAQTIVATGGSSVTTIALATLGTLKGGMVVSSNGLKVPITGVYKVSYQLMWQAASAGVTTAGNYDAVIVKNGTQFVTSSAYAIAGSNPSPGNTIELPLTAGDLIQLAGFQTSGNSEASSFSGAPFVGNNTWLSATLVSA